MIFNATDSSFVATTREGEENVWLRAYEAHSPDVPGVAATVTLTNRQAAQLGIELLRLGIE